MEKSPLHPLNEKLYIFRDIENNPNIEALEVLRELDEKFKQYQWYIGLALMGSVSRNYSTESSDLDFKLIYDSSETSSTKVFEAVKLHSEEIEKAHCFEERHVTIPYIRGFDPERMRKALKDKGEQRARSLAFLDIKDLSGIIIGEKIDQCRDVVRGLLSELSPKERQEVEEKVVDYCVEEEKLSEEKLVQRTGMSEGEVEQLWEARKKLWKNRITKIWS